MLAVRSWTAAAGALQVRHNWPSLNEVHDWVSDEAPAASTGLAFNARPPSNASESQRPPFLHLASVRSKIEYLLKDESAARPLRSHRGRIEARFWLARSRPAPIEPAQRVRSVA